jgi:hypothetical protein
LSHPEIVHISQSVSRKALPLACVLALARAPVGQGHGKKGKSEQTPIIGKPGEEYSSWQFADSTFTEIEWFPFPLDAFSQKMPRIRSRECSFDSRPIE